MTTIDTLPPLTSLSRHELEKRVLNQQATIEHLLDSIKYLDNHNYWKGMYTSKAERFAKLMSTNIDLANQVAGLTDRNRVLKAAIIRSNYAVDNHCALIASFQNQKEGEDDSKEDNEARYHHE